MRLIFLALALPSLAIADPLPRETVPGPAVVEAQADEGGRKVWHTRFFRIDSDLPLSATELARLSQVADTTALVVKAHPLPVFAPPEGKRPRIAIYSSDQDYVKAGGAPGSSGNYVGRAELVLIHGGYLTRPPDATRSKLAARQDEDLVVHEIVHLCMHRVNHGVPQWLAEGIAEYFASAHTGAGRFSFADMDAAIRQHLRVRLSPDDPGIPLVRVEDLVGLDWRGWNQYVTDLPVDERYHAYATALLLAHYQLHGGEKRLADLKNTLAAAPKNRRPVELLTRETAVSTQEMLVRYWKPKGLTLEFPAKSR
ncbi:DUF1570 domain-containing protein [Luteolibacter flavescens]|uniref:DUF1570 domain-containing protein n=1 Tax=Luteolibacter flavescens TaxID=1859460 RepID=A0ABT3FQB0_9BACT|nr:DUF1570 domain-containing protein [Luteolibacter flavescens]MCW1885765.1 DUF1570 domain-containing protein [Luteolibacter flavescens]